MRKIQLAFILISMALFAGCGKENPPTPVFSSVLFVNAAVTSTTTPASSLFLNDSLFSNGIVLYNSNTGYFGVTPGDHVFKVKQEAIAPNQPVTIATAGAGSFGANEAYTIVAYDSLNTGNSIRLMKLRDNLTVPHVDSAKLRVWNLAPNYNFPNPIDVTYIRTSVTPNDSVTFANRQFPGANPVISDYETFRTIPSGTYIIRVKQAGTQTVITNISSLAFPLVAPPAIVIGRRKIYSHYFTGTAQGRPLAINQVTHF